MDRELFERLAKQVCLHFEDTCRGCPFDEFRKSVDAPSCDSARKTHRKDAEIILATWIGGADFVKTLGETEQENIPKTRREILQAAERCVCGGRKMDHGTPEQSFHAIARQWEAYLASRGLLKEGATVNAWDAATMLALFKVARISVGNFVVDSYVDGCGYLACAGELAANEQEEKHEE